MMAPILNKEHYVPALTSYSPESDIVFVWSQYDGANIEQWTIGYSWRQNQESKLKNVGGAISNQQLYNICNCAITFSIVLTSE